MLKKCFDKIVVNIPVQKRKDAKRKVYEQVRKTHLSRYVLRMLSLATKKMQRLAITFDIVKRKNVQ